MIKEYHDKETKRIANGVFSKRFPADLRKRTKMRLDRINAAVELSDLQIPPSHYFEQLKGDRLGQHSIRINKQWRICFIWKDGHAFRVEVTDYH